MNFLTTLAASQALKPEQDLIYELDFQLESSSLWLRADVSVTQALDTIKTGLLEKQPVAKIKLFAISDDDTSIVFIYDIKAAKQGNTPWSIEPVTLKQASQELTLSSSSSLMEQVRTSQLKPS